MFNVFRSLFTLLLIFGLSVSSMGKEWAKIYFPDTVGSTWVYIDQNGDELTRSAVEKKNVDGTTYRAFSYQPELEDLEQYQYLMHPFLYNIGEKWVALYVGDDIETATKSILSKRLDETIASMRLLIAEKLPPGITIDFDYTVNPTAQDYFYLFPIPITYNEEWIAMELTVKVNMSMDINGAAVEPPEELKSIMSTTNFEERGKVIGKETVETQAGKFDDCIKIEYRTLTSTDTTLPPQIKQLMPIQEMQESVSTLWLAPNVGIVKYINNSENTNEVTSFELKSYEIEKDELDTSDSK